LRERGLAAGRDAALDQTPPSPDELTPEQISELLAKADEIEERVKAWAKPFRDYAYNALVDNKPIPGWKLVAKRAQRKFTEDAGPTIEAELGERAFAPRDYISPAQAEKVMGKKAFAASALAQYVVAESSGFNMVPSSHAGAQVEGSRATAAIGFTKVEEE
jgi:hypothetical protein